MARAKAGSEPDAEDITAATFSETGTYYVIYALPRLGFGGPAERTNGTWGILQREVPAESIRIRGSQIATGGRSADGRPEGYIV